MSFYTTLSFYRPTPPPKITAADLATFVSAFASLGAAEGKEGATLGFEIRFGRAVDQDDTPTHRFEPVLRGGSGGGIYVTRPIAFDAEGTDLPSHHALAGAFAALGPGTIYRARLDLGYTAGSVFEGLRREPSQENEVSLDLDSWSMEVGPIASYDLATEAPYQVGWVAVQVSGYGYLYPWTFPDLIGRAESLRPIRAVTDLCRRTWPVAPGAPPRRVVKARKAMAELWPYPRADQPWDWFWGLQEEG
jgi:hypothetical protein